MGGHGQLNREQEGKLPESSTATFISEWSFVLCWFHE